MSPKLTLAALIAAILTTSGALADTGALPQNNDAPDQATLPMQAFAREDVATMDDGAASPTWISFAGNWRLVEVMDFHGSPMDLNGGYYSDAYLSVFEDGLFAADAGCNPIHGDLNLEYGVLSTDVELGNQIMCFVGMDLEAALANAIDRAFMYAHGGEMLVLLSAEGNKLARFEAAD